MNDFHTDDGQRPPETEDVGHEETDMTEIETTQPAMQPMTLYVNTPEGGAIRTTPALDQLAAALAKAQGDVGDPKKNATNPYFSSNYADLAAVLGVIRPALSAHGLSLTQWPTVRDGRVQVTTRLMHESGQWMECDLSCVLQIRAPGGRRGAGPAGTRHDQEEEAGGKPRAGDGDADYVPPALHGRGRRRRRADRRGRERPGRESRRSVEGRGIALTEERLPEGRTCADGRFIPTCDWLIQRQGTETTCDWVPSTCHEKEAHHEIR